MTKNSGITPDHSLRVAAIISVFLAILKLVAFVMTGSVVVLANFFDSLSDALVSFLNSYVHKFARQSPDREHPFGHGGFEVLSSLGQGLIMAGLGLIIAVESFQRLIFAAAAERMNLAELPAAAAILTFGAMAGLGLHLFLRKQSMAVRARGERSLSLEADQGHYEGDAYVNLLSAAGLMAVWFSGMTLLDTFLGLVGAGLLMRSSYPILRNSLRDILHNEADPHFQKQIMTTALDVDPRIKGIHRLRTRESGPVLFVDFHMKLPSGLRLEEAHDIGDRVEAAILQKFPRGDVLIHLDPDTEPDEEEWTRIEIK